MRDPRLWLVLVVIVAAGGLISWQLRGSDQSAPVTQDELEDAVFVCRESGAVFVGKVRPTPATHPSTGKPTLMPGLYDTRKQAWVAAPPFELQQKQRTVGQGGQPLERTGPIPPDAPRI